MKKVFIIVVILAMAGAVYAVDLVTEGFEGTFPPTGWSIEYTHPVAYGYYWHPYSPDFHSGSYSTRVVGDISGTYASDELIYTSSIDLSSYTAASVTFWSKGDYRGAADFALEFSDDVATKGDKALSMRKRIMQLLLQGVIHAL